MSIDVRVAAEAVAEELQRVGLQDPLVVIEQLDPGATVFLTKVTSASFDGQTYLDRETRVRPAVARALTHKLPAGASVVLEVLTPEEVELADGEPLSGESYAGGEATAESLNRRHWREHKKFLLNAIERSQYDIAAISQDTVYAASRTGLSHERIIVAFAPSPNASVVDIATRRTIQEHRQLHGYAAAYYIAPSPLDRPFSNQPNAPWLTVCTPGTFLHSLNSSQKLAARLAEQCVAELTSSDRAQRGPVIEPEMRLDGGVLAGSFFDFVDAWLARPGPSFLVLMAPAGHGKTTVVLELARRISNQLLEAENLETPVALYVGFESVRRTVDFEALVHKRLAELRVGAFGAFAELLRIHKAVLLVDGFDELAEDAGPAVAEAQVRSMQPLLRGDAKIILAGRSVFTQEFAGAQTIAERVRALVGNVDVEVAEFLPFGGEQVSEYVGSREGLDTSAREKVVEFSRASPDHEELCGNPLFLRMLCSLAAANQMPAAEEVSEGVDALIDKVCLREEDRQHLGLGIEGQLNFLIWIASDVFKAHAAGGRSSLPSDDVRLMASVVLENNRDTRPEIVGRLADHALLVSAGPGRLTFIHPFIRDVLLAKAVLREDSLANNIAGWADLPEGTVERLARLAGAGTRGLLRNLPRSWLSTPSALPSRLRRNLARLALASARFARSGSPRDWWDSEWSDNGIVRGLDLSGLAIESSSFRALRLQECNLESSYLDDCTLASVRFERCNLSYATLNECTFDANTAIFGGQTLGMFVIREAEAPNIFDEPQLFQDWITKLYAALPAAPSPRRPDVVGVCRRLARQILGGLIDTAGAAPHFHRLTRGRFDKDMTALGANGDEKRAIERILVPGLVAHVCTTDLHQGSREIISVEKRWHGAVVRFVRDDEVTPGLQDLLARLASRAARYLE